MNFSVVQVLCNDFCHSVVALKARTGLKITIMHYACCIQDTRINLGCLTCLFSMTLFLVVSW